MEAAKKLQNCVHGGLVYAVYGCHLTLRALAEHGSGLAFDAMNSLAFRSEMERFLPAAVIERTIGRAAYLGLMCEDVARACDMLARQRWGSVTLLFSEPRRPDIARVCE